MAILCLRMLLNPNVNVVSRFFLGLLFCCAEGFVSSANEMVGVLCCGFSGSATKLMCDMPWFGWLWMLSETFVSPLVVMFVRLIANLFSCGGCSPGFVLGPW